MYMKKCTVDKHKQLEYEYLERVSRTSYGIREGSTLFDFCMIHDNDKSTCALKKGRPNQTSLFRTPDCIFIHASSMIYLFFFDALNEVHRPWKLPVLE